jgi:hypothetical protein
MGVLQKSYSASTAAQTSRGVCLARCDRDIRRSGRAVERRGRWVGSLRSKAVGQVGLSCSGSDAPSLALAYPRELPT